MTVDNILTVDVEDWFHICGVENLIPEANLSQLESRVAQNTLKILEILYKKGAKPLSLSWALWRKDIRI